MTGSCGRAALAAREAAAAGVHCHLGALQCHREAGKSASVPDGALKASVLLSTEHAHGSPAGWGQASHC